MTAIKLFEAPLGEVITNFAEEPNMGNKAIFESSANVAEHTIASKVVYV